MDDRNIRTDTTANAAYSIAARRFHWWTVALVATQIPLGLYMAYRGKVLDIWDGITNNLYSTHKLLGVVIFVVVLARLIYRLIQGAPPDEPTLTWWQKAASHLNHWGLYLFLLAVPIGGYIGISLYPALDIFGLFSLPGLVAPNQDAAARIFYYHWLGAVVIVLLVGMHIAAALFHYFIRKDGVLQRMLVSAGRRS
jgi:cytochrome b561